MALSSFEMTYGALNWSFISSQTCVRILLVFLLSFFQVRSWMEETIPGVNHCILSYVVGLDSLKATSNGTESWQSCGDIRLRMDGLFKLKEHAVQLTKEFTALYTNGPAGGGGIR